MTVSRVAVFCGVTLSLLAISVTSAWAGDCANHNAKLDGLQADMKEYLGRLALLWQILSDAGFPNQFFCDSWAVGFWRADHEEHTA
jgi:hypothetical protein